MAVPKGPGGGYDTGQILGLAYAVGWRSFGQVVATCIAHAESSFVPGAVGHNGPTQGCPHGSRDRGLWQINDCYHPDVNDACAFDPVCNAQHAYRLSNGGQDFGPWSTYTRGLYKAYLPETRAVFNSGSWQRWVGEWSKGGVFVAGSSPQGQAEWVWDQHVHRTAVRANVAAKSLHATDQAIHHLSRMR